MNLKMQQEMLKVISTLCGIMLISVVILSLHLVRQSSLHHAQPSPQGPCTCLKPTGTGSSSSSSPSSAFPRTGSSILSEDENDKVQKNSKRVIRTKLSSRRKGVHVNTTGGRLRTQRRKPSKLASKKREEKAEKWLIYLCDSRSSCGGWGDRQRGIANSFAIANLTGRRFGINMTVPCDVKHYFAPNHVNWKVREEEIRGRSARYIHNVGNQSFHDSLREIDVNAAYPEDVLFLKTNVEHFFTLRNNPHYVRRLPVWMIHGRPRFFKTVWELLMKPTPQLKTLVDRVLNNCSFRNRTRPLVCAHVRIGKSSTFKGDSETRNDPSKLAPLWTFLRSFVENGSQVFLATDNAHVRQTSRTLFGPSHHDTGGLITHIDKHRHGSQACEGFEFALLDQLVLVQCDVLVTSRSMFSHRAALLRGTSKDLFQYHDGLVTKIDLK